MNIRYYVNATDPTDQRIWVVTVPPAAWENGVRRNLRERELTVLKRILQRDALARPQPRILVPVMPMPVIPKTKKPK